MSKKRDVPQRPADAPAVVGVQSPAPVADAPADAKPSGPVWIVEHGGNVLRVACDLLEDAVREWNARYGRSRAVTAKQLSIRKG